MYAVQYLPDWLPGTNFKRVAKELRSKSAKILNDPFNELMSSMVCSTFALFFTVSGIAHSVH
jgi:hypothetical protein